MDGVFEQSWWVMKEKGRSSVNLNCNVSDAYTGGLVELIRSPILQLIDGTRHRVWKMCMNT